MAKMYAAHGTVVAVCAFNVLISVVSTCLYYRLLWALKTSPAFSLQLTTAMQVVLCGFALCALDLGGVARRSQSRSISLGRWLELAFWLCLQNTLEIASIDGLGSANGNLVPVLQQAVVPITLLLSIGLLGRRYGVRHWLGAALVVGGLTASYAPLAARSGSGVPWGWAAAFLLSRVPQSLANVRCEAVLLLAAAGEGGSVRGWTGVRAVLRVGFWTALIGMPLNVMSSALLAAARGTDAVAAVAADYRAGFDCLFFKMDRPASPPPPMLGTAAAVVAVGGGATEHRCAAAAGAVAAFSLPGVLFALSEFQVVQYASASAYFLLSAFVLPLQAAALSAPFVMGSLASSWHPSLLAGVPLIACGLALWASVERRHDGRGDGDRCTPLADADHAPAVTPDEAGADCSYLHVQ